MAEPEAVRDAPEQPDMATRSTVESTVDLRIVSPSWEAVDIPVFAELPASTSVGQLKERVRKEVAARGRSWLGMRLIYRGRVLDADERTLGNVFGPNMGSGALAVHLVLRDTHGNRSAQQQPPTASAPPSASASTHGPPSSHDTTTNTPPQPFHFDPQQIHQQRLLRAQAVAAAAANAHFAQHWAAVNRLQQGLPVATMPTVPTVPTVPTAATAPVTPAAQTAPAVPAMPQGSTNRVYFSSTVLPAPVPGSQVHGHATPARPNFDESSDDEYIASMFTPMPSTRQNNLAQTSSSATASRRPDVYILTSPTGPRALLIRDQATTTYFARDTRMSVVDNQNTSGASVAELRNRVHQQNQRILNLERGMDPRTLQARQTGTAGLSRVPAGAQQQQQLREFQEQQRLGQFRLLEQRRMQWQENVRLNQQQAAQGAQQLQEEMRQRADRQHLHHQENQLQLLRQHNQLLERQQQQPHAQVFRRGHLRINNPGAGMIAAMVPHIWLVMRLLLFVWWFTSPNASWTRWTMVILLATIMFVANTGMLDGVANQMWAPVRRHLDGLLPAANDGARAGAAAPTQNGAAAETGGNPNPEQMAARLVGQRREANATWLMDMIRRAERLGIMFVASLAPGVAERHVALAEQRQAEAARRQREEQEAAARAAEEAEAAATAAAEVTATTEAAAETGAAVVAETAEVAAVAE